MADYACVDFEAGMPPASVWVPSVQESSVLQLTNVALSPPNGLESTSVASPTLGNEVLLRWTTPATTAKLKKVSVSAALNPALNQRFDADYWLLCAAMSASFASRTCIVYGMQGMRITYRIYNGSGYINGECPASGTLSQEQWTNVELHLDPVTGLIQAIIGGTTTNCQASDIPLEDTVGFVEVGLTRDLDSGTGYSARYDNVEVVVRR